MAELCFKFINCLKFLESEVTLLFPLMFFQTQKETAMVEVGNNCSLKQITLHVEEIRFLLFTDFFFLILVQVLPWSCLCETPLITIFNI